MRIRHNVFPLTLLLLLLTCACAFFGFGGYMPGGAPAAQVLFYILLTLSFLASMLLVLHPNT